MKFLHLSDLHIGLRMYEHSFIEDQKHMLNAAIDVVENEAVEAVLIAGDIYDKQIPPAEAMAVFDSFISRLADMNIPVLISSGNHDSTERLSFGGSIMSAKGVHISPVYNGNIKPITLTDKYGEFDAYMIPFIKPADVRRFFEDVNIESYTDAMRAVISALPIDATKRNILICHQNVGTSTQCESVVGGLDMIDANVFEQFDYVALGHIHEAYPVLRDSIRYCGTVLCHEFKFCGSKTGFYVIDMDENGEISKKFIDYFPQHPMLKLRGELAELISPDKIDQRAVNSYLQITLTDEQEAIDSVGKLRAAYPYVLSVEYDNMRTRTEQYIKLGGDTNEKSPFQLFSEFYELQNNAKLNDEQEQIVKQIIEEVWG